MGNDASLRERVLRAAARGELPLDRPYRTWGGPSAGARCTICSEPVLADQPEIEIELAGGSLGTARQSQHLHVQCFDAWRLERRRARAAGSEPARRELTMQPPAAETSSSSDL